MAPLLPARRLGLAIVNLRDQSSDHPESGVLTSTGELRVIAPGAERNESASRWPGRFGIGASIAFYLGAAIYAYWPASLLSSTRLVGGGIGDSAGQVSSISWTPFAISHGLNLFFTNAMNYPNGVNLASNAFFPLVGIIVWPITATLGPIAATNLAFVLAFFVSATSMFVVLHRMTKFVPGAFLGGLLYGFSPYMVGQGLGHLAILVQPIAPVVFYLLFELLGDLRHSARYLGISIGICLGLQAYIATEVIATTALVSFVGVVLVAIMRWRIVPQRITRVLTALMWSIGTFAIIAGYPLWYQLAGPGHLSGPPQPLLTLDSYRTDLLGPIVPTFLQRLAPAHFVAIGSSYAAGNVAENGIYVGIPLLVASIVLGITCWRNLVIRTCLFVAFAAFVLSLGPSLVINGHGTGISLPFKLLTHIPLLSGEVPGRYSLFVDLALAIALGLGVTELTSRLKARLRNSATTRRPSLLQRVAALSVAILGAAVLIPLIPTFPIGTSSVSVPKFFHSNALGRIPKNSVLLAYPYPEPGAFDQALVWQAVAKWRFKIVGGYGIFRAVNGVGTPYPSVLPPRLIQDLFDVAYYDASAPPGQAALGRLRPMSKITTREVRTFLRRYDVATIAMQPDGDNPQLVLQYLRPVVGKPRMVGNMYVWFDVQKLIKEGTR
jgi:hypothetical protein